MMAIRSRMQPLAARHEPIDGINLRIEAIKRAAHDFRDDDRLFLQIRAATSEVGRSTKKRALASYGEGPRIRENRTLTVARW